MPVPLLPVPPTPATASTRRLQVQRVGTVVAHIPFPSGVRVADYEIEAWRIFAQIAHRQPIVNGYSGYFPLTTHLSSRRWPANFPRRICDANWRKGWGDKTLVVDQSWLVNHRAALTGVQPFLQPAYSDAQTQIYHLAISDRDCPIPAAP